MLRDELWEIADPVLRKIMDHPFWSGLRDGSLPGEALVHFVQQDTGYLLPAFARALARLGALATEDSHTLLLGQCVHATLEAKDRLWKAFVELAPRLGIAPPTAQAPIDPATHAHCSFFHAATSTSLADGIGAVLPMVWFNVDLSDDLRDQQITGGRYAEWIAIYHPGEEYEYAVRVFLDMVEEIGERCSAADRQRLVEQFSIGVRYEWAFAEGAVRKPTWPV